MANVFLLGPSEWQDKQPGFSPMDHRRELAKILRGHGHEVVLMEDAEDEAGEDIVSKFERLFKRATDIVLYWPVGAKMSTTYSEMVLLRKASEAGRLPRLWFLHHEDVAVIEHGVFKALEAGGRSRYLNSLARLGITSIRWRSVEELRERAGLLAAQLV